jgi:hypothetical protein
VAAHHRVHRLRRRLRQAPTARHIEIFVKSISAAREISVASPPESAPTSRCRRLPCTGARQSARAPILRMWGCARRRGRSRASVAGAVQNDSRIVVIVRELRITDLPKQIIHLHQIFIGGVKFGLDAASDGFALGAGVARFADEQIVVGNGVVQGRQLGGGHAVIGEVRKVRVRGGGNVLAMVAGLHVASAHQFAHGKIHGRGEGMVLDLDGVGVDGTGDGQRDGAHGLSRDLFVRRDAGVVLCLALRERLDVGDTSSEVGVGIGKRLKNLPNGGVGVANSLDRQIHGQFVKLFGVHGLIQVDFRSLRLSYEYGCKVQIFQKNEKNAQNSIKSASNKDFQPIK